MFLHPHLTKDCSISFLPCHPNPATFDPVSWHSILLLSDSKEVFATFSTPTLSGFADGPQFSLLSWEIPPNLQCLFWAGISSKTLTAFTGGQNEYFPRKEPRKCKMIATWIFARQYLLPNGCAGSALVRNNAQYLAVLQNLASSLLVCLWHITVTLWTACWTPSTGKMTR